MNSNGGRHGGATDGWDAADNGPLRAHSFVVRALAERREGGWFGVVTDASTGQRQVWRRPSDVARFIGHQLADRPLRIEGAAMAGPVMTDVVTEMLGVLGARLPTPVPALPDPNVTVERIAEKLVGLGNQRGTELTPSLGQRTLGGGRLDGRVRFQLWGGTAPAVDTAVLVLQSDLLDDRDVLRQSGFLRFNAAETTLAERVDSVNAWRKVTSFDVLYEYSYVNTDDADSLIVRIPIRVDQDVASEVQTLTDEMVRWDDETAPDMQVRGPSTVRRLSALVFVPGPALGGTVVLARSNGAGGPVTHLPDLNAFLDATGGQLPAVAEADVTLAPADFFAALVASGDTLDLGDWDTDGSTDTYLGFDRRLDRPIELAGPDDRFTVMYIAPGPQGGLDPTAVVYLRVNAP